MLAARNNPRRNPIDILGNVLPRIKQSEEYQNLLSETNEHDLNMFVAQIVNAAYYFNSKTLKNIYDLPDKYNVKEDEDLYDTVKDLYLLVIRQIINFDRSNSNKGMTNIDRQKSYETMFSPEQIQKLRNDGMEDFEIDELKRKLIWKENFTEITVPQFNKMAEFDFLDKLWGLEKLEEVDLNPTEWKSYRKRPSSSDRLPRAFNYHKLIAG
jgi:hypothetical protein